ncbi:CatB-related O-acetyltransferase [Roseococcus sp. DSY-14]|uniref:CatB-related O-acetyltransferase n=1 Tax=Roseococcus sp. DSY-14 TaxID=3369650 RepID=UPI00387B972D
MLVSEEFIAALRAARILLQPPAAARAAERLGEEAPAGQHGWMKAGQKVVPAAPITLEERTGLYGGRYRPSIGGDFGSGLFSCGAFTYSYSAIHDEVTVGRYCSISAGLAFLDSHHPLDWVTTSAVTFRPKNPLFHDLLPPGLAKRYPFDPRGPKPYPAIGHDVWIARDVTLAMGVTLGTGCVVAAGSVVTRSVEPYMIVAGNPAQPRRRRFPDALCERLLGSRWWRFGPDVVLALPATEPERFCGELEEAEAAGRVAEFAARRVVVSRDGWEALG